MDAQIKIGDRVTYMVPKPHRSWMLHAIVEEINDDNAVVRSVNLRSYGKVFKLKINQLSIWK